MRGFSLIELIITLVIAGILATISVPNYIAYHTRAERSRAIAALIQQSADWEIYFSDHGTYVGAPINQTLTQDAAYRLKAISVEATQYLMSAVPLGAQARRDSHCGALILSESNGHSISGGGEVASCWAGR